MKSQYRVGFTFWVLIMLVIGSVMVPQGQGAQAQTISQDAQMNKSFTPIDIVAGGTSRLRIIIYNPNPFPLTNASWSDNLVGVQPGLFIDTPPNVVNTCGGSVTANPGGATLSLSGGTVPQAGVTPGSCYVEVSVSSIIADNLINVIPPNALTSTGDLGPVTNTDEARATLHVSGTGAPNVAKNFNPTTIWAGQTTRLTISIANTDLNNPLTQVTLTDTLPANVVVAAPPNVTTNNCGAGANVNAAGNAVTLTNGTIPPNMTCTIGVDVTSNVDGIYTNTIPPGAVDTQEGVSNPSAATANLNVQSVGLTKSFNPPAILPGGTTTLTITIENSTSTPLTNVSLTDTLPGTELEYVAGTGATTCGAGTVTITLPRTLTLTGGTVPAGTPTSPGTCTVTVQVRVPDPATARNWTNTIPASSLTNTQGLTNITPATDRLTVYPAGGGVTGGKAFNPSTIPAGGTSVLQILVRAPQDIALTNVTITDVLPGNVTIVNPPLPTINNNCGGAAVISAPNTGSTITLTNGNIPAGAACRITVTVTGNIPGDYVNTIQPAQITNNEGRTVPGPLTDTLTVIGTSDLSASKTFQPGTIGVNGVSQLTVTLTNTNTSPLVNVSVTDTLPGTPANGLVVAPVPNAVTTCTGGIITANPGSQTISMTGGTIPAQVGGVPGTCTIRVDVQATGFATTWTNTIPTTNVSGTIQGTSTVINPAQPATAQLIVTPIDINIVKGFQPTSVTGGSASTLSIQLINPNAFPLSGIQFTDSMPAGMIVANPVSPDTGTCGGIISATSGAGSFSYSGGSLPGFGTCTLSLMITLTINGNRTNIIPIDAVTTLEGATNPKSTDASLTNLAGASVSKFFSPNPINVGDYSLLTITIQNTGPIPLTSMALVDNLPGTLPNGLAVAGSPAPAPVNNCGGTLTANAGSQTIALAGGTLAANSTCTLVVPITSVVTGCYTNSILAGALFSDQSVTNSEPATDTLCVTGGTNDGMTKTLVGTSEEVTSGTNVAIGEMVTYEVAVIIPAATTLTNARMVDTMDQGLSFVACDSITGGQLTTDVTDPGGQMAPFDYICATPVVDSAGGGMPVDIGRRVTFNFGTLTNPSGGDQTLTIRYHAIVLDSLPNQDGKDLNNSASFLWSNGSKGPVSTRVHVVEPDLAITKTSNTSFIAQGSQAIFTLTIQHTAASHTDAFDVVLEDPLPTSLDYVAGSLDCTVGAQDPDSCAYDSTTRMIHAEWSVFTRAGGTGQLTLRVTPNATFVSNSEVTNVGIVDWTSLPGPREPANDNPYSTERFYDPGSPINVYGARAQVVLNPLGGGGRHRSVLKTGFAPGVVTPLGGQPAAKYDPLGVSVEIPRLNIRQPVVGVALEKGEWNVSWLTNQIGWLQKTAFPSFEGNSVLTGHVTTQYGVDGPFAQLYRMNNGDKVFIHAFGQLYVYEVRSVKKLSAEDISVFNHEENPWLTLVTCADYDEASGTYLSRLVVRAVLIGSQPDITLR